MTTTAQHHVVETPHGALTVHPDADPLSRQLAGEVVAYLHADRRSVYVRGMTRTMAFTSEVGENADAALALNHAVTTVVAQMRKHGHSGPVVTR